MNIIYLEFFYKSVSFLVKMAAQEDMARLFAQPHQNYN